MISRLFFLVTFQKRCGEFCVGTYPDTGHNVWDKAWREDFLWEGLFSKTNDAERNRRTASSKNVVHSLQKSSTHIRLMISKGG